MRYTSTRSNSISCTFEEAICSGYAPDGGLFVPETLPSVSAETLKEWSQLTYPDLARQILRLFISPDEVSDDDLSQICTAAFVGFENPAQAVPLVRLGSLYIAELFHGPTFCFKDLGMRAVVNLLSHFCTKRQKSTTLLISTTGDTGPAAVQAVSDTDNPLLSILVHYPFNQISDFQRKQLTTVDSPCVHVVAFEGGGDDMDKPIEHMLTTTSQTDDNKQLWTGVNSYNIGRPLIQTVHYVWTYLRVAQQQGMDIGDPSQTVDIILPTGAMGNIAGGYMAKKMGVPLGMLNAAVNVNDITDRVVQTGAFHKSAAMIKTLSEAINVQVPYNFERLLFYLTEQNHELVQAWMTQMDVTQRLDLSQDWLVKLQMEFNSARVTDDEMCDVIRTALQEHKYLADPHTAVALAAAKKLGYYDSSLPSDSSPHTRRRLAALLATASPCKFEESVTVAIGTEGWNKYRTGDTFPKTAEQVLAKEERPPTIYKAETQVEWGRIARDLVSALGRANTR